MIRYMFLIPVALLAACSGGGAQPALQSAALSGTVIELDGQTEDRSGVAVTVLESGETAVTGPDGSFRFDRVPTGTVTLAFGAARSALAQESESESESENEMENENEDRDGNRIIRGVEDGERIEVRCSLDDGKVTEFSRSDDTGVEAEIKARRDGLEAEVEVESETDGDKFEVKVEGLAVGASVDVLLDDPADETAPVLLATLVTGADGKAELEIRTRDGGTLPGGATSVADLAGLIVILELADTGEELFRLEVPALPDMPSSGGSGSGGDGERMRGKARLVATGADVEGKVEIRTRPERSEQRFKMEAEQLATGDEVRFEIEDPDNAGSFLLLATAVANADGEAEISTQDGLAVPLGVTDVGELVGLEVRVVRSGTTILSGTVPALVRD